MKTEVVPFKAFMNNTYKTPTTLDAIIAHYKRHKTFYRVAGAAVTLIVVMDVSVVHAAVPGGIDAVAKPFYYKMTGVGKWVIAIKGVFDTIQNVVQGDTVSARRNFLSYLLVYGVLLALPWGMDQIELLFANGGV